MTAGFGGSGYTSPQTRALNSIANGGPADTSSQEAMVELLQKHSAQLKYLASNQKQMQQGINDATANPIQQLQQFVADIIVLLGGGELAKGALDFGDLQYILPALGALFGFGDGPFPISLFEAASKFFLGYVVPQEQFVDVINSIITAWAGVFGIDPEFIADVRDLIAAVGNLFGGIGNLFPSLNELFGALGITGADLGPLGQLIAPIIQLFAGIDLTKFGDFIEFITDAISPFIEQLTALINFINGMLAVLGYDGGDVVNSPIELLLRPFQNLIKFLADLNLFDPDFDLGAAAEAFVNLIIAPLNIFSIPDDVQADINAALGNMKDALNGTYTGSGPIFVAVQALAEAWLTATSPLNAANVFGRFGLGQFGGGVPLNALTAAVSNELEPFRATSELPATGDGDRDGWSFNASEDAAQVVCDGSPKALYLKSGVIKVESGQPLDTSVSVKYSGVTSGAGQAIRYVLETFTTDDGSGSATPVTVGAITNPSGTITTPVSLGDSSWDIPTGVKSVRPVLECDELITAGTVFWKNTPELFKELAGPLADGLVPALDNAGQAIRDAIANALGHAGTGHTSANILTYLQSIPQTVVSGLTDLNTLTNQIRDIFAGIVVTPINSTVQAIKDWFNGVVGKTQNLTSGGNLPPSNVGSPTGGTNIGQDILDTLNGIWAGLRGAGSASGKTATDVAAATAATADLVTQVSSIAARLDTSVTQVIRGGGGGATDQFEREDANLGADWDSTNTGAGAIATNGSAAYWEPVGGSAAMQIARNALVETATNFQKVSFVLTEPLNTVSGWMLLGRMNSAKTTYVYMFTKKDYREIGYVNGGSPVVLASSSDPFDPPPGAKISGHFGVNFYGVVDEDAFSLGDYPGYGNSLNVNSSAPPKGDTYRSMGMGAKVSTASGAQVSPGALELWTGGDSKSPPTVGVHLDVDTPVSFTALSSSGPYFTSGFFSVSRQSDFITFDPTTTTFTVELPGAYQIFAQLELSAALATGNTMELLLISPSVHSERSMRALAGMVSVQMSPVVYLEAGDSVRLAYTTAGAGSKSVVGSLRVAKLSPPYFA